MSDTGAAGFCEGADPQSGEEDDLAIVSGTCGVLAVCAASTTRFDTSSSPAGARSPVAAVFTAPCLVSTPAVFSSGFAISFSLPSPLFSFVLDASTFANGVSVATSFSCAAETAKSGVSAADSIATSGMVSATLDAFSLRSASSLTDVVLRSSGSILSLPSLKLPRRRPALLSSRVSSGTLPPDSPNSVVLAIVMLPAAGSTGTKLARTLDVGRLGVLSFQPAEDRPRWSGADVFAAAAAAASDALFSKIDRRLRTADEERSEDMADTAGQQERPMNDGNSEHR